MIDPMTKSHFIKLASAIHCEELVFSPRASEKCLQLKNQTQREVTHQIFSKLHLGTFSVQKGTWSPKKTI